MTTTGSEPDIVAAHSGSGTLAAPASYVDSQTT